jgi:serine/threonine protein kinase
MSNEGELVGKAIDNKWHILKKIGSGSFGQVFIGKKLIKKPHSD